MSKEQNKIADIRKKEGLTQSAFAKKLLVTTRTVSRWETGVSVPRGKLIKERIRILFGADI